MHVRTFGDRYSRRPGIDEFMDRAVHRDWLKNGRDGWSRSFKRYPGRTRVKNDGTPHPAIDVHDLVCSTVNNESAYCTLSIQYRYWLISFVAGNQRTYTVFFIAVMKYISMERYSSSSPSKNRRRCIERRLSSSKVVHEILRQRRMHRSFSR